MLSNSELFGLQIVCLFQVQFGFRGFRKNQKFLVLKGNRFKLDSFAEVLPFYNLVFYFIMDPKFTEYSDYVNGFKVGEDTIFTNSGQYPSLVITNRINSNFPSSGLHFTDVPFISQNSEPASFPPSVSVNSDEVLLPSSTGGRLEGDSSSPNGTYPSDPILRYISQLLMEENLEDEPWEDPLALRDTVQSLYEVLGEQYPPPNNQSQLFLNHNAERRPESNISGSKRNCGSNSHSSTTPSTSTGTHNLWVDYIRDCNPSLLQVPLLSDHNFQSNSNEPPSQLSVNSTNTLGNMGNVLMESTATEFMVQNMFTDMESVLLFKRGFEEASKFLPSSNQLTIDVGSSTFAANQKERVSNVMIKEGKHDMQQSPVGSRGRKNQKQEERDLEEEKNTKQSAVYVDESELPEMFDKVLFCLSKDDGNETIQHEGGKSLQMDEQPNESNGGVIYSKRIDSRPLLILCAQAVSSCDRRTAGELLKQIREHSSPFGDGSQRLAHYFVNGLEARLDRSGAGFQNFISLTSRKVSAADALKAYKVHLTACPFRKLAIGFAIKTICDMAEKVTVIHIVDFGIGYGFQWSNLFQLLSTRPGGPPKLRITGIELPQRGLRPAGNNVETGRRLAKYCEHYKVPFEFNSLAVQNWETIQLEDLKIDQNEMLAVNNHFRFETLLDETAELDCPRNAVLNLIRSMNPDVVVHSIVNASYNTPFFLTRFREALFHFSAVYDVFDTTVPCEEPARLMLENEFSGHEAMNVVACEGLQRVYRPETYKQWQVRNIRAGFKPRPLDQELMQILRDKLKNFYHKDFVIDEDGHWMLQGWKGRILYASSCWVPP